MSKNPYAEVARTCLFVFVAMGLLIVLLTGEPRTLFVVAWVCGAVFAVFSLLIVLRQRAAARYKIGDLPWRDDPRSEG